MAFTKRRKFTANWTPDREGVKHPSAMEAAWFDGLLQRRDLGLIRDLEREPGWSIDLPDASGALQHVCKVRADARFFDIEAGCVRVLDFKGIEGNTRESILKRRLVAIVHGVEIELAGPARRAADRSDGLKAFKRAERAKAKEAKKRPAAKT